MLFQSQDTVNLSEPAVGIFSSGLEGSDKSMPMRMEKETLTKSTLFIKFLILFIEIVLRNS